MSLGGGGVPFHAGLCREARTRRFFHLMQGPDNCPVPRQAMYVLVFRVTAPRFVLMFPFPLLFINLFVVFQPPQLPSWLLASFPRGQTFGTKFTFYHLITTWVFMATWNPMFMVWLLSADPPFVIGVCPSFLRKPSLCANQHPAGPTFLMFPCAGKAQPIQKAAAQPTCPRPEISLTCFPYDDIAGKSWSFSLLNV